MIFTLKSMTSSTGENIAISQPHSFLSLCVINSHLPAILFDYNFIVYRNFHHDSLHL
jgi:hypothetical protein